MGYGEKSEYIKSLIKLKQQKEVMEKALDNFTRCAKFEPEILGIMQNMQHSYSTDREKLSVSLRSSVLEITNDFKELRLIIKDLQENNKIDVDGFKQKLMNFANKIQTFKENCSLEDLSNEEAELDQYLYGFSLTKYDTQSNSMKPSSCANEFFKNGDDRSGYKNCRDISDFHALIAKTGHTQNWSEEDHLFFLKTRKMSHSIPAMVKEIRRQCPYLSAERIVSHEAWYKMYLDLREKQRKNVGEWRIKKDSERGNKVENAETECRSSNRHKKIAHDEICNESAASDQNLRCNGRVARKKVFSTSKTNETLTRWRIDKNNARALTDVHTKLELDSRRIRKENQRLARARQLKMAVTAYREKKMENLASNSGSSVSNSTKILAKSEGAKLIESFRRQDEKYINRRKALLTLKVSNASILDRHKIHSKSEGNSTLLNPTKVWLEKCKKSERVSEQLQRVSYVKDIPKLGSCSWKNEQSVAFNS